MFTLVMLSESKINGTCKFIIVVGVKQRFRFTDKYACFGKVNAFKSRVRVFL